MNLRSQSTLSNKIEVCYKNMTVLLYTYFFNINISLNVLRPTFCYKNEQLIIRKNTSMVLCNSLLEMCVQSLKLIS